MGCQWSGYDLSPMIAGEAKSEVEHEAQARRELADRVTNLEKKVEKIERIISSFKERTQVYG